MQYKEYMDLAYRIKDILKDDINGVIRFVICEKEDAIVFTLNYKDFDSMHLINNIQEKIYTGVTANEIVEGIEKEYLNRIRNMYFKSVYKKRREKEKNELPV